MSLQLMKERVRHSGSTARKEMIIDGQNHLKEELEHDSSYSPTMYFYNPILGCDDKPAKVRIYKRKYSSLNGYYQNFLTTYDNPIKIGEYLHDTKDDTYWLINNSFNVNDVHYEGKMVQCNYLLRWQLSDGSIIERWANIVSASKYDVGENRNSTLILSSNSYTILIGYCDEGFELEGKRVFIDMNPINPIKIFKITRSDDVLYNSGNTGSLLNFIADKTEFDPNRDNQHQKICDYINPPDSLLPISPISDKITNYKCIISGNTNLKNSYKRSYIVSFSDKNGDITDWNKIKYHWHIVGDFDTKKINCDTYNNQAILFIDDEELIGSSFLLQIIVNHSVISEIKITITE